MENKWTRRLGSISSIGVIHVESLNDGVYTVDCLHLTDLNF